MDAERTPPLYAVAMLEGEPVPDPTAETYEDLNRAYRLFNEQLFDGRLDPCLITLRSRQHLAYFSPRRVANSKATVAPAHEIALNLEEFGVHTIEQCLSTLVRMQVHQLQYQERTRGRRGYENADFAERMRAIGLGVERASGSESRERMRHYIIPGGRFSRAAQQLLAEDGFRARWADRFISRAAASWGEDVGEVVALVQQATRDVAAQQASEAGEVPESSAEPIPAPAGSNIAAMPAPAALAAPQARRVEPTAPADLGELPPALRMPEAFHAPDPDRAISKAKFQCPLCRHAAWGKPSLNLVCGDCRVYMNRALEDRSHLGAAKARPFRVETGTRH